MLAMHTLKRAQTESIWQTFGLEHALAALEKQTLPRPSVEDLTCILLKCRDEKIPALAVRLHAYICDNGLGTHPLLGNPLVSLLVEVGSMSQAREVFDSLQHQDERSWNILITGYVKHEQPKLALSLYEQMKENASLRPSGYSFAALLKACTMLKDVQRGCLIHVGIVRKGLLGRDMFVDSTLVDMYVKCGSLMKAREVFDRLSVRNAVVWTAIIQGYVKHGDGEEALCCVEQMLLEGIQLDAVTIVCSSGACGTMGATEKLQGLHAEAVKLGLESELLVGSALVDAYAKSGLLEEAQTVFDGLTAVDVVAWTALISGYVDCELGQKALQCFEKMQHQGFSPGPITFLSGLRACIIMDSADKGREIHADVVRKGLEREVIVGSTIVDMYTKCSSLMEAQDVFEKLPAPNLVTWTSLIAGYVEHGHGEEALIFFDKMCKSDISPCTLTFTSVLKACGSIGAIDRGQKVYSEILRRGLLESEFFHGSILVDMYAKCGLLEKAQEVFDSLLEHNVVSWTALLGGYSEHGGSEEAMECFDRMQQNGVAPGPTTYVCGLKACSHEGFTCRGREMHAEIGKKGFESELLVGNALVDMYVKCGLLAEAQDVFEKLPIHDVVTWTTLITGYAQRGKSEAALCAFNKMLGEGTVPNLVTFGSLLYACSHTGLMERGHIFLSALTNGYGFSPTLQHYTCLVDLLGRAGHVDKAVAMVDKIPFPPGSVAWHTVMGACQKLGEVLIGRHAFENARHFNEKDFSAFACMSKIYAEACMQNDAMGAPGLLDKFPQKF